MSARRRPRSEVRFEHPVTPGALTARGVSVDAMHVAGGGRRPGMVVRYAVSVTARVGAVSDHLREEALPVFLKHAAYRVQREYRFVVWAEEGTRGGLGGSPDLARGGRRHGVASTGRASQRLRVGQEGGTMDRGGAGQRLGAKRARRGAARPRRTPQPGRSAAALRGRAAAGRPARVDRDVCGT